MLKQQHRLKLDRDFTQIYRYGRKIKSENFTLYWAKLPKFTPDAALPRGRRGGSPHTLKWRGVLPPLAEQASSFVGRKPRASRRGDFTSWRAGIVVSKRVSKMASQRNLYKRRLSAALRQLWNKLPPPPRGLIIVVNKNIVKQTLADSKIELAAAIKKIW